MDTVKKCASVEEHKVPNGHVGITVDVDGADMFTLVVAGEKLVEFMDGLESHLRGVGYAQIVAETAMTATTGCRNNDSDALNAAGSVALWLSLNEPSGGKEFRTHVAQNIRDNRPSHFTFCYANGGLAIELGEKFRSLREFSKYASEAKIPDGVMLLDPPVREAPIMH